MIERALAFLKANQNVETAGFGFMGSDSAETISMAIVGLTALRIDPCGPEYVKNGKTMLDALLTFVNPDGGMRAWDGSSNSLTTYQSLSALEAYARFVENGTAFYDLSDLTREQNPLKRQAQQNQQHCLLPNPRQTVCRKAERKWIIQKIHPQAPAWQWQGLLRWRSSLPVR